MDVSFKLFFVDLIQTFRHFFFIFVFLIFSMTLYAAIDNMLCASKIKKKVGESFMIINTEFFKIRHCLLTFK